MTTTAESLAEKLHGCGRVLPKCLQDLGWDVPRHQKQLAFVGGEVPGDSPNDLLRRPNETVLELAQVGIRHPEFGGEPLEAHAFLLTKATKGSAELHAETVGEG